MKNIKTFEHFFYDETKTKKELQHPEGADEKGNCKKCGGTRYTTFNRKEDECTCEGGSLVNKLDDGGLNYNPYHKR